MNWLRIVALFCVSIGLCHNSAAQAPSHAPPLLMTAQQVRILSGDQAAGSLPVHLTGVVTVPSTYKNSFFFMDSSGVISVDRVDESLPAMRAGTRVEVDGHTSRGLFAPLVVANQVRIVGSQKLPEPRTFHAEELRGGQQDSQWMAVRGDVRSAQIQSFWGHEVLVLRVDIGSGSLLSVQVRDYSQGGWDRLVGAQVLMKGACATVFNDRRQFVAARLIVANLEDVIIEKPGPADPFALPLRSIESLFQFAPAGTGAGPVKVRGTVTSAVPGELLYLQDGPHALLVHTSQTQRVAIGTSVEVIGYPVSGDYSPLLDDARFRVIPGSSPVSPLVTRPADMVVLDQGSFWAAPFDGLLVQLDAQIVGQSSDELQDQIILRDGNVIFRAKLRNGNGHLNNFEPGTIVRVTGICSARIDDIRNAHAFLLLLRSSQDVSVLKAVPWWRSVRAGWGVASALLSILVVGSLTFLFSKFLGMRAMAMKDSLTGVLNRRGFLLLARRMLQQAERDETNLVLFYFDVNRFKQINDTYGHQAGDIALMSVGAVLRECFRPNDAIGRLGGDEFAVFCAVADSQISNIERRITHRLRQKNLDKGLQFAVELSVGSLSCCKPLQPLSIEALIERADRAMYERKKTGTFGR